MRMKTLFFYLLIICCNKLSAQGRIGINTNSPQAMQALTGRKMSGLEKMNFRLAQNKMRKSIAADGTIKNKKIAKFLTKKGNAGETGFHIGGFALGFFLGLIGVVIAYVINDDYKRNRVKWAWIGWGIFVVLYVALLIAFWDSLYY